MPIDEARRRARAAAEQRRLLAKNSGKRLGGAPVLRGTDMRKLRADAAQRRIEVTQGCASGTDNSTELAEEASRNGFRTKAEEDDANEQAIMQAFIELIQEEEREKYGSSYIPPSHEHPAGPQTGGFPGPSSSRDVAPEPFEEAAPVETTEANGPTASNSSYEAPWTCPTCTLENPPNYLCCDACAAERPAPTAAKPTGPPQRPPTREIARPEPPRTKKRPLQIEQDEEKDSAPRDTFAFKNRTRALDTLASLNRDVNKRPLGWLCDSCATFMETQWWTCSCCGKMKPSS